jgi:hypothetical protein
MNWAGASTRATMRSIRLLDVMMSFCSSLRAIAKQSRATSKNWIASSQELLAMTTKSVRALLRDNTVSKNNIISKKKSRAQALL